MPGKNNRRFGQRADEPKPLRATVSNTILGDEQERLLAGFVLACVVSGLGVYVKRSDRSGVISVKIYDGDESFADMIYPHEITIELCDDLAKSVGAQAHFRAFISRTASK